MGSILQRLVFFGLATALVVSHGLAAVIPGVQITDSIVPTDSTDEFPTHQALYGKGGLRRVASIAERDAIPTQRREAGMEVYVSADLQTYRLAEDLTRWIPVQGVLSVPSVTALLALPPDTLAASTLIRTLGHTVPGRGGLTYRYDAGSSAATNLGTVLAPTNGVGRLMAIDWDGDVQALGGIPNDSVDDLPAFRSAQDARVVEGGGVVRMTQSGVYTFSSTFEVKRGISLIGVTDQRWADIHSIVPTNLHYYAAGSSVIWMTNGANAPAIICASTNGAVKQPNEVWEDGSVYDSIEQNSTFKDFVIAGNEPGQTKNNCDGIFARAKWNVKIENVHITGCAGYAIRLLDCNVFRIVGGSAMSQSLRGRGIFMFGCADISIQGSSFGGFQGPIVWLDGATTWKNVFSHGFWYNPWRTNSAWVATPATSGVWTTSSSHLLETGDPCVLSVSGGSLPANRSTTNTFWAVRLSATTLGLHSTYQQAIAGVYQTNSDVGSGTMTVSVGPASGIFSHNLAGNSTFTDIRCDQPGDDAITLHRSDYNTFTAVQASEAGGSANGESYLSKAGIRIIDSNYNKFVAPLMYGVPFAQAYGVWIESGVGNELIAPSFNSIAISNVVDIPGTNWRNLNGYALGVGSPALELGASAIGTVLDLTGNNGGARMITLERPTLANAHVGIGVGTDTHVFFNEARTNTSASLVGATNSVTLGLGGISAAPRQASIEGEDASGTDVAGGGFILAAGQGTGAAAPPAIRFQIPQPGGSGSSAQGLSTRFEINQPASPAANDSVTLIHWWDGGAWIQRRILIGAADSGGVGFRQLRILN